MPPVQLTPAIRSAPGGANALSDVEIQHLRAIPYEQYLQSRWWIDRRNRALRDAQYRCVVCESKRELQVHHVTYERLGCELPEDLEVVCRGCHLGHHHNETQAGVGIYARVLSDVIGDMPAAEFSDVVEEAKQRCATLKIPYNHERFQAAVSRVDSRIPFRPPERRLELYQVAEEGQPLSRAEASGLLLKHGLSVMMKHMPEVKPRTVRQAEHMKALAILMQGITAQIERCEAAEQAVEKATDESETAITAARSRTATSSAVCAWAV